jgi:hypothetical protein
MPEAGARGRGLIGALRRGFPPNKNDDAFASLDGRCEELHTLTSLGSIEEKDPWQSISPQATMLAKAP